MLGKVTGLTGKNRRCVWDWEGISWKTFSRCRTSYRNQPSLAQLPTEEFTFCFEKVKGNLQIL